MGKSVNDAHPILRMFQLCEAMKWSHLPIAGGIYDQSPELLDGFLIIFGERARHEASESAKHEREQKRGGRKVAGRR